MDSTHSTSAPTKEEEEERLHFQKVVNAFRLYKKHSLEAIKRRENYLVTLPVDHQKMLRKHGYQDGLEELKSGVEQNNKIIGHILSDVDHMFENVSHDSRGDAEARVRPTMMDMEKVQSTLKQIVRDWSDAGAVERENCHGKILTKLLSLFGEVEDRAELKVLVPGAGLGRLAFEIAKLGFECQGNEFSLYMLFTSNFILNKCRSINCFNVFPYVHNFCNNKSTKDQVTKATFPDIDPNELAEDAKFSMAAGDFMEVYNEAEYVSSQDCVVTCFFLDCAHNMIDFIQTIHRILKTGGKWINLGPLLYHFADIPGENSIEPSYEIIRAIILDLGFEFLSEEDVDCTYDQNPNSMLKYSYNCNFFTCQKL